MGKWGGNPCRMLGGQLVMQPLPSACHSITHGPATGAASEMLPQTASTDICYRHCYRHLLQTLLQTPTTDTCYRQLLDTPAANPATDTCYRSSAWQRSGRPAFMRQRAWLYQHMAVHCGTTCFVESHAADIIDYVQRSSTAFKRLHSWCWELMQVKPSMNCFCVPTGRLVSQYALTCNFFQAATRIQWRQTFLCMRSLAMMQCHASLIGPDK